MRNQIGYTIFFVSVVVACWAMHTSLDQDVVAQDRVAKTVAYLAEPMVKSKEVAGLSIGIVSLDESGKLKSETLHFGNAMGFGMTAEAKPPTDDTLYEIGGMTKALTGILLASAVQRDEVELTTPADDIMPEGMTMPSHEGKKISLLHLATHHSGLPRIADNMPEANFDDPYANYTSTLAGEFLNHYKLTRRPGSQYEYSNLGMSYLGHLLTIKSGAENYDELLLERLTGPLKMPSTKPLVPGDDSKLAVGHTATGTKAANWHWADMPGAGGVRANIADMNQFMIANLKPPGDPVGKSIDLAFEQHVSPVGSAFGRGLGWTIARDGQTRWRNGRTGGFSSAMFINRELGLGVCVLCNTSHDGITGLAERLTQMKAGLKVMAPSSEEQTDVEGDVMDRYVGRYQLTPQFIFNIRRKGKQLTVQATNQPTIRLYARSDVEWFCKTVKASLLFSDIKDGKANSLTLIQNGLRQKASRIGDSDGGGYPKLSPFSAIRWNKETPEVEIKGKWYELVSLDGQDVNDILSFSRHTFQSRWKKRFEEDLVEVLTRMGHAPETKIDIAVKPLETVTLKDVAMTKRNRDAIREAATTRVK